MVMRRLEKAAKIMKTFEDRYESLYTSLRPALSANETQQVLTTALRHITTNQLTTHGTAGMVEDQLISTIRSMLSVRIRRLQMAAINLTQEDSTPTQQGTTGDCA